MENKIVVSSYRAYSSREQARFIRQEANVLLEKANEFSTTSRRVNRRSAYKVLARSLEKTRGLPFSIRKHQALTELSNYISLAKYNKIVGLEAFNTDLLPTSHPRSTRMNSMTASALAEAQMRWVLDDPRIKDETVKSLLASAMFSPIDSPEHKYSMARLENMPQGHVPVEVLLAAANPYAGKNSAAARRAREAVQLSDRFERWINMGASLGKRATDGFRVFVKRNDGSTKSLSGELLNQNMFDPNLVDIEMGKGKVATVPTKLGEGLEAFIKSKDTEDGYSPVEAKVPNGAQVLPESSIVVSDAPSIYRNDGGNKFTDDKYDIVKFDNPKAAQTAISDGQKRAAELDKPEPKLLKKGEVDPDSGKQFWDIEEPVFAVYRRGKNTPLAFAQSWKDVNNEILRDEPFLDEDEGRKYTRPEPQTADDNVPLLDQADDILKPTKKQDSKKKKKEVSSFPYEVPDRAYELNPNEEYSPEFEFDDPVTIANDQTPEELEDALLTAVEPVSDSEKATGYAPISFTDGREKDVPAEAIAAAIREQGGDAEMALAQAYDKIAGDNKNEQALLESRGEKAPEVEEAPIEDGEIEPSPSDKIIEDEIEKPEPKPTTPEPQEVPEEGLEDLEDVSEDTYVPPLLEGLSEDELAKFKEDGDYRPYLPKNADIDTPEGLYKLDPNPVDPKENFTPEALRGEAPETTALDLSANTVKDLTSELSNAINGTGEHGLGFGEMLTEDPNGEFVNSPIPAEAIRDALQLKGKDTDAIIEKINKKATKAKAKIKPPASEEPEAEPDTTEEKPKPKKGANYKRVGNRTLLRAGKGGAFKDKEIADFLDENGFEWTGELEKDGKTLKVNSESALQTDEEFKAFARELRDRFGIDLEPRPATAMSPAQEPIDFDAPAPETPAPTSTPEPEAEEEPTPEEKEEPKPLSPDDEVRTPETAIPWFKDENGELQPQWVERVSDGVIFDVKNNNKIVSKPQPPMEPTTATRPDLPKELRENDLLFGRNILGVEPEDQRQIRAEDGALFDGNGKFVGYVDDASFNMSNREMASWLNSYYKNLDASKAKKPEEQNTLELQVEMDILEELLKEDDLDELEKDRVIKRINDIREELGESPSSEEEVPNEEAVQEAVQEVVEESKTEDGIGPYEGLLTRIKNKLIERGNKRFGISSLEAVQDAIIDIAKDPEKAYDLAGLIRNYQLKRDRKDGAPKNPLNLTREEMIKRLMWFKFKAGAVKNESYLVQKAMKDYEKDLKSLSNEDMIAILELYYDEMDAKVAQENEERQRRIDVAEARARKRREREDKLLNEGEEEETPEEAPDGRKRLVKEERPTGTANEGDLSPGGDWVYVKARPGDPTSREGWFASDQLNEKYEKYGYDVSKWPEFEEEEPKPEPEPSEPPLPPLSADAKEILRALVDRRRKIQRKIDKADLDETTTASKRKALKDELDEVTRIIDSLVMGTKPAEAPATSATPETPTTPDAAPEEPASPAQLLQGVTTNNLKPGDVLVGDHFTITDIKKEGTKKVNVGGKTQDIPAYRVSGYFPGSVEQSSKLWSENYAPDVYRGATPPAMGDSPALNQPKAEDYGTEFAWPNQTPVKFGERTLNAPKNKELADKFLEDYAVYDAERLRRKALWEAPQIAKENSDSYNSPITPTNTIYVENVPASEVKVGDIAFRKNKLGAGEFFTVTKVVGTKDGVTTLEGHYVGHQTQTKEWRSGTTIDVIRGEKNLPAAGDKEPLDRPDKSLPNASELEKERKAKIAEADKGYTPNFPSKTAEQGITPLATKPQLPAFYGTAEELLALGDGPAILEALDALENGYVVFDFETIGKDVHNVQDPDAPIQAAAVKYVKGEKVGELNLYINPEEPLGNFYYTEEDGKRVLKKDRVRDSEGNPVTDEWLATQPSVKEQLQKLVDFFGPDAILVGQNNSFDINVLERFAEKLGIDFKLSGAIDTVGIARALQKREFATITLPENPSEGDTVTSSQGNTWEFKDGRWKQSNKLEDLARRLGVLTGEGDKFHDALFDVEITEKVLRALLGKMKAGEVSAGGSKSYDGKYSAWLDSREKRKKELADIAIANAWSGNVSSNDELIANVKDSLDEKVSDVNGEEEVLTPKTYTSKLFGDTITSDWVLDPENTDLITIQNKDVILGDFMTGKNGELYEVIGFEDDEVKPFEARKIHRTNLEDPTITLDSRDLSPNTRKDGGTGFFDVGKMSVYRRKENAGKTTPQIRRDIKDPNDVSPKPIDLVPDVEPVKGEPLTDEQIDNVAGQAIAEIVALSKPQDADETVPVKTIEETVPDLNLDSSVKEQVKKRIKLDLKPGTPSDAHLSADGVPLAEGDSVINAKNGRVGKVSTLFALYNGKYTNYLLIRYKDREDREPGSSKSLTLVSRPSEIKVKGEETVTDIVAKIKDIQGDAPVEGAPDPEELAAKIKAAQEERDEKAKELNLVQISKDIVDKIKPNAPLKESTDSSIPSAKSGKPISVTFAFDNPTVKDIKDFGDILGLNSEDIIVFKANAQLIFKDKPLAAIKPDGSITWINEDTKRKNSLEIQRVLQKFAGPVVNISAMAIMPKPDKIEQEDFGNGTLTGTQESTFDYDTISKFPPTDEQIAVVDAVMEGKDVVVQALAGSGKTATLVLAARRLLAQRPDKKLLYIVFNKETAEEALGRMPENVDSRTMDGVAASMYPSWVRDRLKTNAGRIYFGKDGKAKEKRYKQLKKIIKENAKTNKEMSPEEKKEYGEILASTRKYIPYGDFVNLFDYYKFQQVPVSIRGTETNWGAQDLVKEMLEVIDSFAISKDDVISEKHFVKLDDKTRKVVAYYDSVPKILIDYANRMWDDLSSDEGWDPTSPNISRLDFSHLLKRWALTSPQFIDGINSGSTSRGKFLGRKNDLFFFDEAQDMNPVIVDLLDKQEGIQKVYVGDSNQAIYGFRGAVDELNNVKNATELYLTRTFRFGDVIAGVANRFLTLLKSPKKIVGKPGEDFGKLVDNMEDPDAYIARTNAAIVAGIFDFIGKGKNPGLNLETYYKVDRYIKSAKWLMADPAKRWERPIMDDELAGYETWAQVTAAYYEGKNVGTGARLINRLKDDLGIDINEISDKIKRIAPIRGTGFKDDEYVPLTKEEALKEGETVVGNEKNNAGQIQKVTYEIKDGVITFKNTHSYQDFFFFKEEGWTYQNFTQVKTFTKEEEDDLVTKINDIRRWILNFKPRVPIDIEFITAHKAKGKQWKRVKLADDFPVPQPGDVEEDEGEDGTVLPSNEELRVLYVAASRAEEALDIGENQKWIYNVTGPEDEKPTVTPMEEAMGMSIEADPEPLTPEEVGNLIIEDQKVSDKKANEVAQKIIELMEKGITPWTKGWNAYGLVASNAFTKKSYQGSNLLAIWAAMAENNWEDNRFIGAGQAKKLGGYVRKGEKGTMILAPKPFKKDVKQPDGTVKQESWMRFEGRYVFNISQIENVNFPPVVAREPIPILEVENQLLGLYKDHPTIRYELMGGGKRQAAYYTSTLDEVVLPLREQFETPNALIETLFHELAHSTGHVSRLGKDGKRKDLQDNYDNHYQSRGEEELIAELSVALLAAEFGVEIDWGNTANYIDFWLKPFKENPDMIMTAMAQAQAAVNYMLGKKPTYDQVSTKALYPNLQDYLDGGSGGIEGTRSTVGFVKTSALEGMNGNTPGNREMVEKYKAALTEGKGFAIREFEGKPFNDPIMVIYDNETGMAFVGEGNHRLQAAIELNLPYVPVRVVKGNASEMGANEKTGKSPKQIKNGKEPKFIETVGDLAGKPVSEGYIPPEFHPKYVFDEDLLVEEDSYEFPKAPETEATPVGEGVGSEGLTGEQIAEDGGLRPEPIPEPNVGEQGQTGEEIASNTGVASIKGEYQNGTPNSGDLKDSMKYEIQMDERNLTSGQTTGGMYGVRKLVISGNTYSNREALKAAGFKYDGTAKNWSKSYLGKVFKTDTLTQEVLDNNPDPDITEDLSKFSKNSSVKRNVPKNKDTSVNPIKFKFFGEEYDLWNDISGEGDNDKKLENGHAQLGKDLLLGKEMVVERDEIDLYVSQILEKYGYGKKFVMLLDGKEADNFLGDDPLVKDENGEYRNGQEAAIGLANDDFLELNHPLKGTPHPILMARERGTSKISLLHEIAHLMEGGWRKGVGGGHNQTWHQTYLTLLRGEGFQEEADLIVSKLGEKEGDTGAIGS